MTEPGRATATACPAATFGAPAIGVGVLDRREHPADDEALDRVDPVMVDAVDFGARHGQPGGELAQGQLGRDVVVQPGERDPHPNCSRKRASFS